MSRKKGPVSSDTRTRIIEAFIICILIFSFLTYRLVDIQMIKSEEYVKMLERQSTARIDLNTGRGVIYDRNNVPLTDTKEYTVLMFKKEELMDNEDLLDLIAEATEISENEIYKMINDQVSEDVIEIAVDSIDESKKDELSENNIMVTNKTERYSDDNLLSHTIGYIKNDDKVGQYGIERSMEEVLNSSNEEYIEAFRAGDLGNTDEVDILKGSVEEVNNEEKDQHLRLTIDYEIQKKVEDIVNKEQNPTAVVISDIETGEVLSMSSRPTFSYDNMFMEGEEDDGRYVNRTIQSTYAPGSIFKMVILFAGLESGEVDEDYTYNCTGKTMITGSNNEFVTCPKEGGHGFQSLEQAFANSCNTAFYNITSKIGKDKVTSAAETLKLTEKVDLGIEEEKSGQIPQDTPINLMTYGQGSIAVTPLQVNQMTQIIANNGTYKQLYIYDSIIDNDKDIVKTFEKSKEDEMISPYYITKVKEIMKTVSKEGTGKELKDLEGGCGIKTGTAETSKENVENGWVTGFYPEENPKYAITVLVEGTEEESKSAVPIFKEICETLS